MNKEELNFADSELKKSIDELEGTKFLSAFYILDWIIKMNEKNKELHNKIDKAIEYIEKCSLGEDYYGNPVMLAKEDEGKYLLEILKDSDVDE